MKRCVPRWLNPGIAGKLHLGFGALFLLIGLIMAAWLLSLHLVNQARDTISRSFAIERTVLGMDRLLEKARRLHGDFFLQHSRIGLAEAHRQFAQPSARLIAEAITVSSELQKMLQQSGVGERLRQQHVDLTVYLSTAKRFADTSMESTELITRLADPEQGLEEEFYQLLAALQAGTSNLATLQRLCLALQDFYQEYRIARQRHIMQSAFNVLFDLQQRTDAAEALTVPARQDLHDLIIRLKGTGEEILATDLAIRNKFNDFTLQANTALPIAQTLVELAAAEVARAQDRVIRTLRIASFFLVLFTVAALGGGLVVSRFIARRITGRIKELADAANRIQQGQLDIAATEVPNDELGQLGHTFNLMSDRIRELVDGLELKVQQRTMQLAESERRFRRIANELPNVGIIGFNRNREIFFWNHTCERIYGPSGTEAIGQKIEHLIAEESQRGVLEERLQQWIDQDISIPPGEARFRHRDGRPVQVFASSFMVATTHDQKEMYSIHIDLTELKEAKKESALKESVYRNLFDHTSSGVGVCEAVEGGRDFIIKDMNRAAEQLEGYTRRELVGRRLTESFPGVEPAGLLATVRRVWQTGEPVTLPPMRYQSADRYRWLQGHMYRIPSKEVVFVYDDITKLREVELEHAAMETKLERARKMEAIGLLAGGVAHDLNNILSGIVNYPELILMQLDPDSKLRKAVLAIQASGQRAAAVVADLLTVARGVSSERRSCDLNLLVQEYLSSPEHQLLLTLYPGVDCSARLAKEAWPLSCSPVHLKKSLMNLVTNAAEAIGRTGQITIRTGNEVLEQTATITPEIDPGRYVVLEVADSGGGIADADLEHIFEPFYSKKVMGRSGTGLGLAVVWNTMLDHKGGVTVSSDGEGTVFTLFFPAAADESLPQEKRTDAAPRRGAGETILVVDDEPQIRDIAAQMLKILGYEVVAVASGEQAVEYLKEHRADLVLLDMLMEPGMNGRQTYEQIIAFHAGQKALIASGFSEDEEVQRALRQGVSGYLQKPYVLRSLGKAIDEILHPQG